MISYLQKGTSEMKQVFQTMYYQLVIKNTLSRGLLIVLLFLVSIGLSVIIALKGVVAGIFFLCFIIGLPLIWGSVQSPQFALLLAIFISYFMFLVKRISGIYDLPVGLLADFMILLSIVGILIKKRKIDSSYKNPITLTFVLLILYLVLQVFNPNAFSTRAWFELALRSTVFFVFIYVVSLHAFKSYKFVKFFTAFWLFMAFLAAVYGIYQEFVGLPYFDERWIHSDDLLFRLAFQGGRLRKWSFLGDISSYGVIMAYSGIFCTVMMLGPFKKSLRWIFGISAALMYMGMVYSGTRTAYVMVPVGLILYVLLTITRKRTLLFAVSGLAFIVVILFGPFYGPNINRVRSAFYPEHDPSMQVRENNREFIRPYIYAHPIGGGIGTTSFGEKYHPGHKLAGFPPDSGYMMTVLETGYLGLIINLMMYFIVLAVGVSKYYRARSKKIKTYYLAYMASFFSITIANYAQNAATYPPANIINICIFVLMFKLILFDKELSSKQPEKNIQ